MSDQLYIPTDASGVQWWDSERRHWPLPADGAGGNEPGDEVEGDLVLYTVAGLLGRLDERIYRAEATEPAGEDVAADLESGAMGARRARVTGATGWDGFAAARFALDCATHVIGDAAGSSLADGTSLAEVLERVGSWLDEAGEVESGHGRRLRQLAICWRLRRTGKAVGDAAFAQFAADVGDDLDALEDPAWTSIAAVRDAVLAAVEAVQHAVLPHLTELEGRRYEHLVRDGTVRETGARTRAHLAWVPYWVAADDAAERARQAALDAGGPDEGAAELAWQGEQLAAVLA